MFPRTLEHLKTHNLKKCICMINLVLKQNWFLQFFKHLSFFLSHHLYVKNTDSCQNNTERRTQRHLRKLSYIKILFSQKNCFRVFVFICRSLCATVCVFKNIILFKIHEICRKQVNLKIRTSENKVIWTHFEKKWFYSRTFRSFRTVARA